MKKILILALLVRLIFIFGQYHPDLGNHLDWGNRFWEYGPKNFYTGSVWTVSWPNQPPGTIYLWGLLSKINQLIFNTAWEINLHVPVFPSAVIPFLVKNLHPALVKLPSVLADLGIGWLIYRLLVHLDLQKKKALWGAGLFLFNPAVIYNSAVWGQTDGIINFLALLSVFLVLKKKFFLGTLAFLFSIYIKLSLIIFLPLFLLLVWREKVPLAKIVLNFVVSFLVIVLISLPFTHNNPILWLKDLYVLRVLGGQGNMLTANAFNLWAVFFGVDLSLSDVGTFLGVSYKLWGELLFGFGYLLTLVKQIKNKITTQSLFFSFALTSFFAFMFLTNMHERYLYPAFPYLALLAAWGGIPLWLYLVVSLIHFLNLYHLWFYPSVDLAIKVFQWPISVRILSLALLSINVYLIFRFYYIKVAKKQ
jgi:dolichyl-phosphate-mannose-protein mannosyltransferase